MKNIFKNLLSGILLSIVTLPWGPQTAQPSVSPENSNAKNSETKSSNSNKGQIVHVKYIRKAGQTYTIHHVEERDRATRQGSRIKSRQDCTYNGKILKVDPAAGVELEWVLQSCVLPEEKLALLPEADQKAVKYLYTELKGLRFHFLIDREEIVHLQNPQEISNYFQALKKLVLDYQKKEGASSSALGMMSALMTPEFFIQVVKQEQYLLLRPTNLEMKIGEMEKGKTEMEMLVGDSIPMQVEYGIESYDPGTDIAVVIFNQTARDEDIKSWIKKLSATMGKPIKDEELNKIKGAQIFIKYRAEVYASTGWVKQITEKTVSSIPGLPASSKDTRMKIARPDK